MSNSKSSIMGSDVNLRKERSETPSVSTTSSKPKKKKNIRQIYIKSVNQNRSVKGGLIKAKNITNLDESNLSKGSSQYLTNEYNLVKKILNATKALERLKTNTDQSSKAEVMSRSSAPKYRTQEEYYEEILELKKSLKMHENNELITKAKMEYYENELAKKEQEILNLLDVKKNEELRSSDAKSDLDIINLKLKAYKLEFSLKRKDAELKKLKDDLKTTNIKELKLQNERLRVELSKALMNDKRILEAQEIKGIKIVDGKPVYEFFKAPVKESTSDSPSKTEVAKQNIAKRLQQSEAYDEEDDAEFVSKYTDVKDKIVLKGTLKEKLEQLDKRETELLKEISRLNQKIEELREEKRSGRSSHRSQSAGSDRSSRSHRSLNEKAQVNAIKTLQSVLKGHLERTKSLEFETKAKAINHSPSPPLTPPFSPEPIKKRDKNESRHQHHNEPHHNRERTHHDEEDQRSNRRLKYSPPSSARSSGRAGAGRPPRQSPPPQPRQKDRIKKNRQIVSDSEDDDEIKTSNSKNNDNDNQNDTKKLIEKKENGVDTDSFGCCSPWRSNVNATSKKFF